LLSLRAKFVLRLQGCYLRNLPVQITLRLTRRCTNMQKRPCPAGLSGWHRDLAQEDLVTEYGAWKFLKVH
ncbi:unnamed protein product, partial [Ilex paraguariensis]